MQTLSWSLGRGRSMRPLCYRGSCTPSCNRLLLATAVRAEVVFFSWLLLRQYFLGAQGVTVEVFSSRQVGRDIFPDMNQACYRIQTDMSKHLEEAGGTYFCGGKVLSTFGVKLYILTVDLIHSVRSIHSAPVGDGWPRSCRPFHVGCIVKAFICFRWDCVSFPLNVGSAQPRGSVFSDSVAGKLFRVVGSFSGPNLFLVGDREGSLLVTTIPGNFLARL